jgi:hypothetical protein
MNNIIFGKRELEMKTKTRIYQSVIAPVLLYGSESWSTQDKHVSRITATEMRCHRKIVGKTKRDRVRGERIREQVGQESVRRVLEERQLRWFGHVYRMERERKPKQFKEAQVEGRKQRGRQRITFESRIQEIGSRRGKTLAEMKKMARDREVWKSWRKAPPTL